MKKADTDAPAVADAAVGLPVDDDASTRARVASSILEHGPSTASDLSKQLHLTPAAVRRHLSVLLQVGHLTSREQRIYGHRGRGRPAKVFLLTDRGRAEFYQAYDRLAIRALGYLRETSGSDAVRQFAEGMTAGVEARFEAIKAEYDAPLDALVQALTDEGYVASVQALASGQQLCQHHCPVAQVAAEFPELCEAETRAFARLLGSHVQRLATIAHGDGVCTTHVPRPVTAADHPRKG
ncbi:MAG: metalloregulator ArsR/SmtB family transcription factor [Micropruina sp.]